MFFFIFYLWFLFFYYQCCRSVYLVNVFVFSNVLAISPHVWTHLLVFSAGNLKPQAEKETEYIIDESLELNKTFCNCSAYCLCCLCRFWRHCFLVFLAQIKQSWEDTMITAKGLFFRTVAQFSLIGKLKDDSLLIQIIGRFWKKKIGIFN